MNHQSETAHLRVIAPNEAKRDRLLERLHCLCHAHAWSLSILQNEPYWKIAGMFEMRFEFGACPTWNYGAWREIYRSLFEQGFTIEWEKNEDINFCYYPTLDKTDFYFVIFSIPSKCFFPKPSKSIKQG